MRRCNECRYSYGECHMNTGDSPRHQVYCRLDTARYLHDEFKEHNCAGFEPRWRLDRAQKAESA